jgi:hypothetical protein
MWSCPLCNRNFKNGNQAHYCGDKTISDFLFGKTDITLLLFDDLISNFEKIGPIRVYATKSMLVIATDTGFAYIINLGKNFIDIVLPFKELYVDNFCFRKMVKVPASNNYNHHLRIMHKEDINEEVLNYMKIAYANGKNI